MDDLAAILKPLADQTRFRILDMRLSHDLCVGALARSLGVSEPAVSQHLQILRKAGLVKGGKRGYWTHYSVDRKLLNEIGSKLIEIANKPPCLNVGCHEAASNVNKNCRKAVLIVSFAWASWH
jgi:ArsR family transcriptional regulator